MGPREYLTAWLRTGQGRIDRNLIHQVVRQALIIPTKFLYPDIETTDLRLAKANTITQTKTNSHFWLIKSILSRIPTFVLPKQKV